MAKEICALLDANAIPYMIGFGTLLGSVRHGGFIPWDDDFDLILFEDTYEHAISLLENGLPDELSVENESTEPLYFHSWARVRDKNSVVEFNNTSDDASLYTAKGLVVDLFCAKKIKKTSYYDFRLIEYLKMIDRKVAKGVIERSECDFYIEGFLEKYMEEAYSHGDDREIYALPLPKGMICCEDVFPLKKYMFADTYFLGPNNGDSVLRYVYGDYMQQPPKDNEKSHYRKVIFK